MPPAGYPAFLQYLQSGRVRKNRDHLFVLDGPWLESIVTSAGLQKPPVRMLLFGLVSLFDMFLLTLVRKHCPEESLLGKIGLWLSIRNTRPRRPTS